MMKLSKKWYLFLMMFMSFQISALEVHVWKKEPIHISFEKGKQRIINLPYHAKMSIPRSLLDKVRIESAGGSIYITALEEFPSTPARIKLLDNGLDIRLFINAMPATENPVEHVKITVWEAPTLRTNKTSTSAQLPSFLSSNSKMKLTDVALLRFASLNYWAPPRLRPQLPSGLSSVKLNKSVELDNLMGYCSLGRFDFRLLDAWKTSDGRYLTVLAVKNLTDKKVYFNMTHLAMQHSKSSPHHLYLTKSGTAGDITTLSIITKLPFESAIHQKPHVFTDFGVNKGCL
ncbi:DUF3438 family protein [Aliivibrio fischeri]|uniref:DUF3438 family protein n=1 Tax=Aliivibrio fischeri TaxID=668 RepID=UPI000B0C3BB6|nr:DUF3438 family protein [Aliivibrio fischeri]